jgi:hypothetical protein
MAAYSIVIGSKTYSATRDADGVALAFDDGPLVMAAGESGVPKIIISEQSAQLQFWLTVVAASTSALATQLLAISNQFNDPDFADNVVVKDGATTLFTLSNNDGTYATRSGEVEVYPQDDLRALAFVTVTFATRNPGDGTDQIFSPARVEAERTISGLLSIVLTADFFPTSSKTAYKAAQDWVHAIKSRSTAPALFPFLPAASVMRVIGEPVFTPAEFNSGEVSKDKCTAQVLLRELDATLTSLNAIWRHAEYIVDASPLSLPAIYGPGFAVSITGRLEAKTAGLASFDTNDTAAGPPSEAAILAAIEVIVSAAKSRASISQLRIVDVRRSISGVGGSVGFVVDAIGDMGANPVLTVDERVTITRRRRVSRVVDTSGKIWNYYIPGFIQSATHSLTITRVGQDPGYARSVLIPSTFELTEERTSAATATTKPAVGLADEGGGTTVYGRTFEYVYEDATGEGGTSGPNLGEFISEISNYSGNVNFGSGQ